MQKKFKQLAAILMVGIIAIQLTACKSELATELLNGINKGQTVKISVQLPSAYTISKSGEATELSDWIQLDQLKTYNQGFRQGFDEIFNINTITDNSQGEVGGKQGCLFVLSKDGQDVRSGNVTLADAFRNKVFVTKYWSDTNNKEALAKLVTQVYKDIDENSPYAVNGVLNAYYNLFSPAENPVSFNGSSPLFRNEFYAFLVRATMPVEELDETPLFGDADQYTKYVNKVQEYNWINFENKGLYEETLNNPISRLEAVYMLIKLNFPELLESADENASAFSDTKNIGDLALKIGFKEEVTKERQNSETGKTEKYKEVIEKDRWQAYTLAYMVQNPDKGMQSELYKAMVVAKQLGLITGSNSRWYEGLSRSEAIDLVIATQIAKNNIYGYATTTEYATIESKDITEEVDNTLVGQAANIVVTSEIEEALQNLTDEQLEIFKATAQLDRDKITSLGTSPDEVEQNQLFSLEINIEDGKLPVNARQLFQAWKKLNGYYNGEYEISAAVVVTEDYKLDLIDEDFEGVDLGTLDDDT